MTSKGIYSFTEKSEIYEILYVQKVNCLKEDVFYITQKLILNVYDEDILNFSHHSWVSTLDYDWLQTSFLKLRFKISTETLSSLTR